MKAFSALFFASALALSPCLAEDGASKVSLFDRLFPADGTRRAQTLPGSTKVAWPLYRSDDLPTGREVTALEATMLSESDLSGQRLYLSGDYIVTANGDQKAAMRLAGDVGVRRIENKPLIRVVVEYTGGSLAPAEKSRLSFNQTSGLQVQRVLKQTDGSFSVFVRCIAQP
jgi:hypothetical protein